MSKYNVYSEFDLEKHKATYTNYLEVIIDESGKVMYAVPSHQEKAIELACRRLEISREELKQMCPRKYWCDFMKWLCMTTGVVAVWTDTCLCGNHATKAQAATLRKLKMAGVYKGPIPPTKYILPEDLAYEIRTAGFEIEHDDDGCYRFGRCSPAGQDFGFTVDPGNSIMELIHALYECHDSYDVSYETFLWLDSSGHGANGAPYDMKDCYEDMEACKGYIIMDGNKDLRCRAGKCLSDANGCHCEICHYAISNGGDECDPEHGYILLENDVVYDATEDGEEFVAALESTE